MVSVRNTAVRTVDRAAASCTRDHCVISSSVEKKYGLFPCFKVAPYLMHKNFGKLAGVSVRPFRIHVDYFNMRKIRLVESLGEFEKFVNALAGVVVAFDRRCGRSQQKYCAVCAAAFLRNG